MIKLNGRYYYVIQFNAISFVFDKEWGTPCYSGDNYRDIKSYRSYTEMNSMEGNSAYCYITFDVENITNVTDKEFIKNEIYTNIYTEVLDA